MEASEVRIGVLEIGVGEGRSKAYQEGGFEEGKKVLHRVESRLRLVCVSRLIGLSLEISVLVNIRREFFHAGGIIFKEAENRITYSVYQTSNPSCFTIVVYN